MLLILKMIQVKEKELNNLLEFNKLCCLAEDLSVTKTILISIGIHEPSYDDCYIIREVCKTVSLRAAKLAAAGKKKQLIVLFVGRLSDTFLIRENYFYVLAIAVLINRLNMSSATVAVDGTLFRHHQKFKENLTRTLDRLVLRTVSFLCITISRMYLIFI
jgi:hexokinase